MASVTNEFLRLAQLRDDFIAPGHWRTHDSDEVDLVLEFQTGAIVGIDFHCGVLIYQREFSDRNADGSIVLPADRLWTD